MQTLAIDIETYSSYDLAKSGVYKYVQAPDFEILLFAYCCDGGNVEVVDLFNMEEIPEHVLKGLTDPRVLKTAFNANFERTCISKYFGMKLRPEQWECTSVKASMLGLPLALEACARVLKVTEQKDTAGKALIRYFSIPCKPTKANGMRSRNTPDNDADKWEAFKNYCKQDVVTEQAVRDKIKFFTIPVMEKKLWQLDQRINDEGVMLDPVFVKNAIHLDSTHRDKLTIEAIGLTGLDNPNSAAQLKKWLAEEMPLSVVDTLKKEDIPVLIKESEGYTGTATKRMLEIRQEMSKTSVSKYDAMRHAIGSDNRLRGLFQFYGANRTGRWAGRIVQPQNLPKNELADLDLARQLVREGDLDMLQMLFGNVPDTLSQLVRTAFVVPSDHRFIIADFSAIEARVIAWLAGEKWRLDVFNTHGKIYEASASQMFKVPLESVTKGSALRQKGKVSELALGYQGGPNALEKMGALKMGIPPEELPKLVAMWRNANKKIVKLWDEMNDAAITAVESGTRTHVKCISFYCKHNILFMRLPSGRELCYQKPTLIPNRFGGMSLAYEGMNQTTKQWCRQDTYGGKLVENAVQAIARDCLADSMLRLDAAGYKIAMHVHDENALEVPNGQGSIEEVNKIMGEPISWAKGLPLTADSYETTYYKKD